jgi:iron complex transport system substrate-binding protein
MKPFLLVAFCLLLITACDRPGLQKPHLSLNPGVECRVIQHEFGETCVPLKPQRIVTLSPLVTLDPLIALGIKPIGFTSSRITQKGKESLFSVSFDRVLGAKNVGNEYQPSLEKILMLKPDLILFCCDAHLHNLLSAITPTVSVPIPSNVPANQAFFKENLRYIATLLGQKTRAEELLSQYQKRIEELKKRLGSQLQQMEISVLFCDRNVIWTIGNKRHSIITSIFNDLGLRYKSSSQGEYARFSLESIDEYDADILFIVNVAERSSSFYLQNPMFSSLKAVKNNRAYVVSQENWYTVGILGANKILDDLEKYLLSPPQSHEYWEN